jgi:hypothetical protein
MEGDRWRRIDKIFHDLIKQTPEQRASLLDSLCADDPSLKKEVEGLIQAYERSGSFLDSPATVSISGSLVGRKLGPYEIQASIGAGGMGEVYRGRDTRLHRTVAIKVLSPSAIHDSQRRRRFLQEARAIAALTIHTSAKSTTLGRITLFSNTSKASLSEVLYQWKMFCDWPSRSLVPSRKPTAQVSSIAI